MSEKADNASTSAGGAAAIGATKESLPVAAGAPAAASSSAAAYSGPVLPARVLSDGANVSLPIQVHSCSTSSVAKSNHFLHTDPIVVVAVDNKPMFKTNIRPNSTTCSWDLSDPADLQSVPGGIRLPERGAKVACPVLLVPVNEVCSVKLQAHQEDFSTQKVDDDMGGFAISIQDIVARSWKSESKKAPAVSDGALSARGGAPPAAGAATAASAAPVAAAVSPSSAASAAAAAAPVPVDGWYPVRITGASLLDRSSGRHLGEISLSLSVKLEPYVQHLVASHTNLHFLVELTTQFLATPSPDNPLRYIFLHPTSLRNFIEFIVKASADKGSMDGERMRERIFTLINKALDVFKDEQKQILATFFADSSELWSTLFQLRRCVPISTLSSHASFAAYESIVTQYIVLVERAADIIEPPPPPPVKTEEELEAERAAAEVAAKRAAQKEKKRRQAAIAAGLDPDDPAAGEGEAGAGGSGSTKKKKGTLGSNNIIPDPPAHPASLLNFNLRTFDLVHELYQVFRTRLTGARMSAPEVDWSSEAKITELVHCDELLIKVQHFLFRFGSQVDSAVAGADGAVAAPPAADDASAAAASSAAAAATAAAPLRTATGELAPSRVGVDALRPLFHKELGDPHAWWYQKQWVSAVKKTRESLAEHRELMNKVTAHSEHFLKLYPVIKSEKEKTTGAAGAKKHKAEAK